MRKHGHKHIYVPNPTWGNHIPIFTNSGLEVRKYRYYDAENSDLDFAGLMEDIKSMPEGSIVLLHACKWFVNGYQNSVNAIVLQILMTALWLNSFLGAHNPTGMDPSLEQWKEMSETIKKHKLLPFFDCAYQGVSLSVSFFPIFLYLYRFLTLFCISLLLETPSRTQQLFVCLSRTVISFPWFKVFPKTLDCMDRESELYQLLVETKMRQSVSSLKWRWLSVQCIRILPVTEHESCRRFWKILDSLKVRHFGAEHEFWQFLVLINDLTFNFLL